MTVTTEAPTAGDIEVPRHMSHSQSNTLATCSWQWYLGRGKRVKEIPTWGATGGSAFHKATEEYDATLYDSRDMPDAELDEMFDQYLTDEINDREKATGRTRDQFYAGGRASKDWPNKENEAWWRANGPVMVRRWKTWRAITPWDLALVPNQDGELVPAIEVGFEVEIGDGPVKGFIDRVFTHQGNYIVLDLKSNARQPDDPKQLGLYSVMFGMVHDYKPTVGTFWMGRTGSTTELYPLGGFTLERFAYEFDAARRLIEARAFIPKVSSLCKACGVRESCYAVTPNVAADVRPY